ncbi:hemoglobin beta embryonic-2 isoform X1 [Betta splendens]|uniref:Hemoglobin beta embryonic-2 isoform X1 n=1 Tax=Betta splendens TaxID=158456 RepID=A0A6P7L8H4_BETSP|nr:hemoglobin beta embryonic-2 isoform X1 [Betta splendens]
MVEWTEQERSIITGIFANLSYEEIGPKALVRCLIVYPWTQRYFSSFGNLYNAEAIRGNPNVAAHGIKVLHGLDRAVKNMDNIKATYAELSVLHSEKLHVDPDNFRVSSAGLQQMHSAHLKADRLVSRRLTFPLFLHQLLADCLTIEIAAKLGTAFTADTQAAFQKFLAVVVSALGRQYH